MKKFLVLALLLVSSSVVLAEEIKLEVTDSMRAKSVNVMPAGEGYLDSVNDDMKNNGFVLQNSISPVQGVNNNSKIAPQRVDEPMVTPPIMMNPLGMMFNNSDE